MLSMETQKALPQLGQLWNQLPALEAKRKMKKQMATVDCPKSMVGRVIGKNGETIRALQNYSGALIQIDQTVDPMKVTISGTPQSLSLAVQMVTDIVNGTFKGFAMLRQIANATDSAEGAMCQPVYQPGYGLIPPSQVLNGQVVGADAPLNLTGQLVPSPPPSVRQSPVSPMDSVLGFESVSEDTSPADIILGLSQSLAQLKTDTCPRHSGSILGTGAQTGMSSSPLDALSAIGGFSMSGISAPSMDMSVSSDREAYQAVRAIGGFSTPDSEGELLSALTSSPIVSEPNRMLSPSPLPNCGSAPRVIESGQFAGWLLLNDPSGRPFCLNVNTGQSQWLTKIESAVLAQS